MPFGYYRRLSAAQQRVYRQSDEIQRLPLPDPLPLRLLAERLAEALLGEERKAVQRTAQALLNGLVDQLKVPPLKVTVHAARPRDHQGELHGLYTPGENAAPGHVAVWMRTAQRKEVVAFRTFLRTLLHELCHHLDYELLKLPYTFHTEGFYKRESDLFHQLWDKPARKKGAASAVPGERSR